MDDFWRNGNLNQRILHGFKSGLLSDFTVHHEVNGETKDYKVHKFMLALASPVFETMFQNDNFDCKSVVINDVDVKTMDYFLKYIYEGIIDWSSIKEVWSLYYLGEKYSVEPLKVGCLKFIENDKDFNNFCTSYEMSKFYGLSSTMTDFKRRMLDEANLKKVLESEGFLELTPESILTLLEEPEFKVREIEIFLACSKWIKNYLEEKKDVENNVENQTSLENSYKKEGETESKSTTMDKKEEEVQTPVTASRPELVQKILSKIFFRDMTPSEFVQVALSKLLTTEEAYSIILNLVDDRKLLGSSQQENNETDSNSALEWPVYFKRNSRKPIIVHQASSINHLRTYLQEINHKKNSYGRRRSKLEPYSKIVR